MVGIVESVPPPLLIRPLAEVHEQLSQIVGEFRAEGAAAPPVVFGAHHEAEAVLLSYRAYREGAEALQALRRECDELREQLSRCRADATAAASGAGRRARTVPGSRRPGRTPRHR
ncbi:hypothetical protein [Nocardia sp. BMG111209]|uniref:hypothetical protein n=1 Tax=Nocardia sp. BMG111209 TaxID=1160137 RepID=UPI000363EF0F|nr:hypothetical protein [Nocardia sp. BMG111209]